MKTYLYFSILLITSAVQVNGAQFGEIVAPNPLYPGKCYQSLSKKGYSVGEKWQVPGFCGEFYCFKEEDGRYLILGNLCGSVAAVPPCRVVDGEKGAPYPRCCSDVQCS